MDDNLKAILLSRVYDVAKKTPLHYAHKLSSRLGTRVYLKREDLQPVHSFKIRGAYNKIAQLTAAQQKAGVIAASAGNHAQGVAFSAQKLGLSALIVMPVTTPAIKVEAVRSYGAEVVLRGDSYSEAYDHCLDLIKSSGRTFVHPFDDPLVIAGQGTIGLEILEKLPDVTHIFVPVGGGGLIAGIAQYVKSLRPEIRIIGVEPGDSNAMQLSVQQQSRVTLPHVGIFADGVAVKQVGEHTFAAARKFVDDLITVNNDEICAAIKAIFEETRTIVEPAGALGVAGITAYAAKHQFGRARLVAINSGANLSFERLQFIAERTLLGSSREALFAVKLPERSGALQKFCETAVNGRSITEFSYRMHRRTHADIFVGISVSGNDDKARFADKLQALRYEFTDLSGDDIAKEHIRHMIGGKSAAAQHERLYHINFPERPGALSQFLATLADRWNISLFHYRGQGGDEGKVLIGFEAEHRQALEDGLQAAGYVFAGVSEESSVKFFL